MENIIKNIYSQTSTPKLEAMQSVMQTYINATDNGSIPKIFKDYEARKYHKIISKELSNRYIDEVRDMGFRTILR